MCVLISEATWLYCRERQHTVLIVFLWVPLIASPHCRWLTPALERSLLSQVLCVWRKNASNIKYFTEEVSPRAKATQPDHIETLYMWFYFLLFVLLNVRIYVTVITASKGWSHKMNPQGDSELKSTRQVRTILIVFFISVSMGRKAKACTRRVFESLLHSFQRTRWTWIVVMRV